MSPTPVGALDGLSGTGGGPSGALAVTGAPVAWLLIGGSLFVIFGIAAVAVARQNKFYRRRGARSVYHSRNARRI